MNTKEIRKAIKELNLTKEDLIKWSDELYKKLNKDGDNITYHKIINTISKISRIVKGME